MPNRPLEVCDVVSPTVERVGARGSGVRALEALGLGGERQGATSVAGVIVSGPGPTWRTTALPEPVRAFAEVPSVAERFALTSRSLFRQWEGATWGRAGALAASQMK